MHPNMFQKCKIYLGKLRNLPPSPEPREMQDIFYAEVPNDPAPEDQVMEEDFPIPGPSNRPDPIRKLIL